MIVSFTNLMILCYKNVYKRLSTLLNCLKAKRLNNQNKQGTKGLLQF